MADKQEKKASKETAIEVRPDRPHFITPTAETLVEKWPTSIDLSTDEGKAQFIACTGVGDLTVEPGKPLRMALEGFLCFPDSRVNEETGEESRFVRTVLIGTDGKTFASSSPVILNRIRAIAQIWPHYPWNPPLIIDIMVRPSKTPNRAYHDLRVCAQR